ncbi:GNAT family N-acetyltransferase [Labrenzia sp. CE80]|uniref:GNAT family N-acetyltransferase n=1 Tax=Labrenzia sp. CE80 TaxID=1788986 RepID=UPI00129B3A71|nr:GNAT family N-acetyltransferase [Labrenzia sp. CE80]
MADRYQIRKAVLSEQVILTELCLRAKASLGYDDDFIEACRDALTVRDSWILDDTFWVAEAIDGEIAGCIRLVVNKGEREGEVATCFIDPGHQRKGLGKLLFAELHRTAQDLALGGLKLESEPLSQSFYEHLGFRKTGEVPSEAIAGRNLPLMQLNLSSE